MPNNVGSGVGPIVAPAGVSVTQIADDIVRIHGAGFLLHAGGDFTIGLNGDAGVDITMPGAFQPRPYADEHGATIPLASSIDVEVNVVGSEAVAAPLIVTKTSSPFRATIANAGATDSGELEAYVKFHS